MTTVTALLLSCTPLFALVLWFAFGHFVLKWTDPPVSIGQPPWRHDERLERRLALAVFVVLPLLGIALHLMHFRIAF